MTEHQSCKYQDTVQEQNLNQIFCVENIHMKLATEAPTLIWYSQLRTKRSADTHFLTKTMKLPLLLMESSPR